MFKWPKPKSKPRFVCIYVFVFIHSYDRYGIYFVAAAKTVHMVGALSVFINQII